MSPFHLAYGSSTSLLIKIMISKYRTKCIEQENNNDLLMQDKVMLAKTMLEAMKHILEYQ